MGTVTNLAEFKAKKEQEEEKRIAKELFDLMSTFMLDDEPVIIAYEDSDGTIHHFNMDELYDLNDSN